MSNICDICKCKFSGIDAEDNLCDLCFFANGGKDELLSAGELSYERLRQGREMKAAGFFMLGASLARWGLKGMPQTEVRKIRMGGIFK